METCSSTAWLPACGWARLGGAGRSRCPTTVAGAGCIIGMAEIVCEAANCPGSNVWAGAASLGSVSDDSVEPARRAAGTRLAAGAAGAAGTPDTAASPCGADRMAFSHVSMSGAVSRCGVSSDDAARPSTVAAPVAPTMPASKSGNMPSPEAVAPVPGVCSAWGSVRGRVEVPGVDARTLGAGSEGGIARAATRRKLQLGGQSEQGAFSRSWSGAVRHGIAQSTISGKLLPRSTAFPICLFGAFRSSLRKL